MDNIEIPNVNKFLENANLKKLIKLIAGLATIVIFTTDIGIELNEWERKFYSNKLFLLAAVFSIGYVDGENINNAIFLFSVWYIIKYIVPKIMNKKTNEEEKK